MSFTGSDSWMLTAYVFVGTHYKYVRLLLILKGSRFNHSSLSKPRQKKSSEVTTYYRQFPKKLRTSIAEKDKGDVYIVRFSLFNRRLVIKWSPFPTVWPADELICKFATSKFMGPLKLHCSCLRFYYKFQFSLGLTWTSLRLDFIAAILHHITATSDSNLNLGTTKWWGLVEVSRTRNVQHHMAFPPGGIFSVKICRCDFQGNQQQTSQKINSPISRHFSKRINASLGRFKYFMNKSAKRAIVSAVSCSLSP